MPIGYEKYLIPLDSWDDDSSWRNVVPEDIKKDLEACASGTYNGPPIGLGKHPEKGWLVMCSGQGPFLGWAEWK